MSDISELFGRDPLSYTREGGEVRKIVEHFRKARGQFNLGNMKAGATKTKAPSEKAQKVASLGLSLGLKLNLGALPKKDAE